MLLVIASLLRRAVRSSIEIFDMRKGDRTLHQGERDRLFHIDVYFSLRA